MAVFRRRPEGDLGRKRIRCSACGRKNHRNRPWGGRYYPDPSATATTGATNTVQGCWFCISPAGDRGGKLGDLAKR